MTLFNFDPFEPLVNQVTRTPAFIPATDVAVSDGDLVLTMDVPGLTQADLSIEMLDGYLVVRGERKVPEVSDKANLTHRERTYGKFERRIKVPDGVDPDAITASLDNGVLSLIVPKPEKMKPKAISIGTGSGTEQRQLETTAS
jgi:HSP20 family protein